MAKDPNEILESLHNGMEKMGEENPNFMKYFKGLLGQTLKEGALSPKTKEIIFVALSVANRCDYCIVHHVYNALEMGATKEELQEAGQVAIAMGGGPNLTYACTLMNDSIEAFAPKFEK